MTALHQVYRTHEDKAPSNLTVDTTATSEQYQGKRNAIRRSVRSMPAGRSQLLGEHVAAREVRLCLFAAGRSIAVVGVSADIASL